MIDSSLLSYIRQTSAHGISRDEIRQELLKVGWDPALVEEAFQNIDGSIISNNTPSTSNSGLSFIRSPHFIKWGVVGLGCILIIALGGWFFKDKLFHAPSSESIQSANISEAVSAPFLVVDDTLKLFDFDEKYDSYDIVYSPNRECFALVLTNVDNLINEAKDPLNSNIDPSFSSPVINEFVWFKDKIVGPIKFSQASQDIKFSDDCTTVAFAALKEDGFRYIYKNGEQINSAGLQETYGSIGFVFEPKTKKIFYTEAGPSETYLWIDDKKFGPYAPLLTLDTSQEFLKFSVDGNHYALKIHEINPEYTKFINEHTPLTLPDISGFHPDKNLSREEQLRQYEEKFENLSEEEQEKILSSFIPFSLDELEKNEKLTEEFGKTSWVDREFLLVDGKQIEPFKTINNFHFTNQGELRYIASKVDGDYLFVNNTLQRIESITPETATVKYYNYFKSSPDGGKYVYSFIERRSPESQTLSKIKSYSKAEFEQFEQEIDNKTYYGVINGEKIDGSVLDPSRYAIFSPDSQHLAYIIAPQENTYYVMYDDKKIGPLKNLSKFSDSNNSIFTFSPDNKLYFTTEDSNETCLYINGEKNNCQKGTFNNFSFQGSSFAYIHAFLNESNQSKQNNLIFNKTVYEIDTRQDIFYHKPTISPDGNKVALIGQDRLFLNGKYLHAASALQNNDDPLLFFTPDSQHVVYANALIDGKIEIIMDSNLVELIDLWQTPNGYGGQYGYLTPSPDKKSVWYIYVDKSTKEMMIRNIKLGL